MSFTDLFSGHAQVYAASRPNYPERVVADLASLAPGSAQALDVGTGNGQSALLLARHFEHVHATDASAAQIGEAFPHERISYAVESAEQCSLGDHSCDLILAAQAAHWFDPDHFGAEVRRLLKPGGIVAAIGYGWFYVDAQVDAIMGERLLNVVEPHWLPATGC